MAEALEIKILLTFIGCTYFILSGTSLILMLKPPKKVNSIIGYHSGNASKDQQTWDYANKLAFRLMFLITQISLVLALASVYFLAGKIPVDGLWLISVFCQCFLLVLILPVVEIKLSSFEESRKNKTG